MHYMLKVRDYLCLIRFNINLTWNESKTFLQLQHPSPKTHFLLFALCIQLSYWKHHSYFREPKPSVAVATPLRRNLRVQAALCSAVTLKSSHPDPSASRFTAPVLPDFPAQMGVTMPCAAPPPPTPPTSWHCHWLSTCQLIVIPAWAGAQRVTHGWNR